MNFKISSFVLAFSIILSSLFFVASVHAYAVPGPKSITPDIPASPETKLNINLNWNDVLNNLSSPFQNFSQSLQSAAKTPIENFNFTVSTGTPGIPENVSAGAQDLWSRFDAWLFGVAGFHIAAVFNFIVHIMVGVLQFAKMSIDWLLALVHA